MRGGSGFSAQMPAGRAQADAGWESKRIGRLHPRGPLARSETASAHRPRAPTARGPRETRGRMAPSRTALPASSSPRASAELESSRAERARLGSGLERLAATCGSGAHRESLSARGRRPPRASRCRPTRSERQPPRRRGAIARADAATCSACVGLAWKRAPEASLRSEPGTPRRSRKGTPVPPGRMESTLTREDDPREDGGPTRR